MKRACLLLALALLCAATARGQITADSLGMHDLSPGGSSPTSGLLSASCLYCHAPHSGAGGMTPLWNQTLSTQAYTPYTSSTYQQKGNPQPPLGGPSNLCLSCHDGTVAPGVTVAYGKITMMGSMNPSDQFSTMQTSHPFSLILPLKDSPDLAATLTTSGTTLDPTGAVHLVQGNIECTTCHEPHVQNRDKNSPNFLVRDSSKGQMCLSCHDPNRVTSTQTNPLAGWPTSIHATAANVVLLQAAAGSYGTVTQNACISCHAPHNAAGAARLLRAPAEQDCVACHAGGSNLSPAPANVFTEFTKAGHPFPTATTPHDPSETAVLNQNRHATCVDCHTAHSSNQVVIFPVPPAIRPSQNGVVGISATDGVNVLDPAINQYENCLRCHGTSIGKATRPIYGYLPTWIVSGADPLNVIPQFSITATSSHPVMHDRSSPLAQPSLRTYMMNLDGVTQGRLVGNRILCTDCHNSDDNREFGGTGPNGPHGSRYWHILERRYEFSQAALPGQPIMNLFPNPDLTVTGPYALCGKCHDLTQVVSNSSFSEHARHINDGFSCSTCHTAHGMGAQSGTITGERLVDFDANVVAPNNGQIAYNRSTNTCTLVCHGKAH